jgi:2-phosphosulfolactate phosphatase
VQVEVADFVAGAERATGIAVVIDVFRAFTTACYASAAGARLIPVADIDAALALRARHPGWLLAAERHARPVPGADFGNSPALLEAAPLAGRTLIHSTHAGTQGLVAARAAAEVLTGSLVNAAAIVRYLRARAPQRVTLVRMGHEARARCAEDDACAELLAARLAGGDPPTSGLAARLRLAPGAAKFFDPAADYAPARDFELCLALDRFDFVLRLGPADAEALRGLEPILA